MSAPDLLERAAAFPGLTDLDALTPECLRQVSAEQGNDFATALLYQRLRTSARHGPFIDRVESLSADPRPHAGALVAVVPGALYQESPHTGADGQLVRATAQELGYETALVPLASFGRLADDVACLAQWLDANAGRPVYLVSSSKGALAVRQALARPDAARLFRWVRAWVDLSGLYHGTPLVAWLARRWFRSLLIRLFFWYRGYPYAALKEIDREACTSDRGSQIPRFKVIHVVGFPRQQDLTSPLARRGHRRLTPLGPNDSVVLLADAVRLPGFVYPVWGADHYLRPSGRDMRPLIARILAYLNQEGAPHEHEDSVAVARG
jgi:hypothetical protein